MITHKTFGDTHMVNTGQRGLDKREQLRRLAEKFIAETLNAKDLICITESGDEYASSVTVWYREEA
jgi:hypothetical protein